MGGSGSFLSKSGWEWVVFIEKWLGVGRFSRKMGGTGLFFLKNGWEWVTVAGSGLESNSVKPYSNGYLSKIIQKYANFSLSPRRDNFVRQFQKKSLF